MTKGGWIKLHRCLPDKAIWHQSIPEHKAILIAVLTMANHREKQWTWQGRKFEARPGQFVTSLEEIRKVAGKGITIKNVRTALARFEHLEFLENESTKTGRKITIVNWGQYQAPEIVRTRTENSDEQTGQKQTKEQAKEESPENPDTAGTANVEGEPAGIDEGIEGAKHGHRGGKARASNKNERMKEGKKVIDKHKSKQARVPVKEITELYQETCKSLPQLRTVTDKRKDTIRARWKKYPTLEIYEELFKRAESSDFLSGRSGKWPGCNFDWLINETNMIKVLEGSYGNRARGQEPQAWDSIKDFLERGDESE